MEHKLIYGIQQIGVGVENATEAFEWYATRLGADVSVFDDSNEATYMAPYMGGQPRKKRAILAMNLQGGSGYEIWQYIDRKPQPPINDVLIGDTGINVAKIKTQDIQVSYDRLKSRGANVLTAIVKDPEGFNTFYITDPYNNLLQIKEFNSWYAKDKDKMDTGGIFGCSLGVSNIDASKKLYCDVLGYNEVIYDETGSFDDLKSLPGGSEKFRRTLLGHPKDRTGGFSRLFGESQIELIEVTTRKPNKIFKDRYWGDLGFIHVCFDIRNMPALTRECDEKGFPFKVLSEASFDMGDANGHWGYIEDPDGTLVEFVETHKVPLVKKLNWNINLRNRPPHKPLPNWLIKAMALNRVKFNGSIKK